MGLQSSPLAVAATAGSHLPEQVVVAILGISNMLVPLLLLAMLRCISGADVIQQQLLLLLLQMA